MKTVLLTTLVIHAFFSFTSCENHLEGFLTYNKYDLEKLVKTERIVSDSLNSIRIAAECMQPVINNLTKIVKRLNYTDLDDNLVGYAQDFRFIAKYIRGHVMNVSQFCFHAKSKTDVMLKSLDYLESVCSKAIDMWDTVEWYNENDLKKTFADLVLDTAIMEQFFYDSCDKISTPITFADDRIRELKLYAKKIDEFTKLLIKDIAENVVDIKRLFQHVDDIHLAASQMLNITDKIEIASDNLFVGKEETPNATANSTLNVNGYKLLQSNLIVLVSRSVSTFVKVTRQSFISSNVSESKVNNKMEELEGEDKNYANREDEIKIDESVCQYPRIGLEITNVLESIAVDNKKAQNLSTSMSDIVTRIQRETPATKELSRTLKRDAIRMKKLLRDVKYGTKYVTSAIATCYPVFNLTPGVRECDYYCPDEMKPVCGVDSQLGYAVFINKCMMDGHNKCKGNNYRVFDIEMCMRTRIKDLQSFHLLWKGTN